MVLPDTERLKSSLPLCPVQQLEVLSGLAKDTGDSKLQQQLAFLQVMGSTLQHALPACSFISKVIAEPGVKCNDARTASGWASDATGLASFGTARGEFTRLKEFLQPFKPDYLKLPIPQTLVELHIPRELQFFANGLEFLLFDSGTK